MEVGNHIREGRERLGISQEDLAREIFVSRQTVSNWETGKTYPDVQSLLLLSNLFDTSLDNLVRGDVEAMSEEIKSYEMDRFKVKAGMALSCALILFGALMMSLLSAQGSEVTSPLFLLAGGVLVAAVVVSGVAWRIEKRHDLETMREVQAFLEGEDPELIVRERRVPSWVRNALMLVLGGFAGALLAMLLSSGVALLSLLLA